MALIINTRPPQAISRPERINCRGERWLARRDPIKATKNRHTDIGSMRIPDSSALSSSTVCRYSGITKNVPATMKYSTSCEAKPARKLGRLSRSSPTKGAPPWVCKCSCQLMKPQATIAPTTTMGIVGENPHSVNGGLIG